MSKELAKLDESLERIDPWSKLRPLVKKALFAWSLGYPDRESRLLCHMSQKQWFDLIHSKLGCAYVQFCKNTYNSEMVVAKEDLLRELVSRLPTANNKDCVAIISQISKMCNFEQQEQQAPIMIVFGDEPRRPSNG